MKLPSRSQQGWAACVGLGLATCLLVGQGCPGLGGGTPSGQPVPGGGGGGGAPALSVRAPSIDQSVAVGDKVTIVYDVSDGSVAGFYDRDGIPDSGDEVTFNAALSTGSNRVTDLFTTGMQPGTYYLGISASNAAGSTTVYATGRVTVTGAMAFTSPAADVSVSAGVAVPIRFSAGTSNFSYRLFYDTDGVFNGNEVTIETGSRTTSNAVQTTWDTTGLLPGTYYVGARLTPAAGGAVTAYSAGLVHIVTGAFVQILSPTVGLVALPGTQVQVIFAASDPSNTDSTVRIFYDEDNTFGNGNEVTIDVLPVTGSGTVWDTTGLPPGNYYVGAELQNGLAPSLYSYSAGPVTLLGEGSNIPSGGGTLTVTTPLIATTIFQGKTFRINWVTGLLPGEGTVSVFREPDYDGDGNPDGAALRVLIGADGIDAARQFVDFDTTGVVGTYFIGVTLTPADGSPAVTEYAPGPLAIRPLVFWVGDLGTKRDAEGVPIPQTTPFQGAVFRGYNLFDNLGSAMMVAADFDGDGRKEIVLASQFGKPFILAQGGRGAGEAYMVYGRAQRYSGDYDVNGVGSPGLPGVIFSGIMPNPHDANETDERALAGSSKVLRVDHTPARPYDTEGLRCIGMIPDQDGDKLPELVFGFPWCNSYTLSLQVQDETYTSPLPGLGRLENNGHFLRGGLVIVSSTNPLLKNRLAVSRVGDRVMPLQEVGQVFDPMSPMRQSTNPTGEGAPRLVDLCNGAAPGTDDNYDYVFFPGEGFTQQTVRFGDVKTMEIDPPRLATALPAYGLKIHAVLYEPLVGFYLGSPYTINMAQVDPPPSLYGSFPFGGVEWPSDHDPERCSLAGSEPPFGYQYVIGTGIYSVVDIGVEAPFPQDACMVPPTPPGANALSTGCENISCQHRVIATTLEPYGARLLGQTTSQEPGTLNPVATTANRFAYSVASSGNFLLVGAPLRTVTANDIPTLAANPPRDEAGCVYMMRLCNLWDSANNPNTPAPHNHIIRDVGYVRCDQPYSPYLTNYALPPEATPQWELKNPFYIVGAAPGDHIGDVTGLHDMNNDDVDDFALAGPDTNQGMGAIYLIYRRQPQVEGNYYLERLQLPTTSPDRLNGLMIIGQPGDHLGTALAGGGALNDDYNDDGFPDLLIGSPNSTPAAGLQAGEVFILFGGKNLLNPGVDATHPYAGLTIAELRAMGYGCLLTGVHAGDLAGSTVANAGDINGDGIPDILISAPNASPRYIDKNGVEQIGLDYNGDGFADDLDGDGAPDDLTGAGLVYVVFGGPHLTGTIGLEQIGTANLPGFTLVGRKGGYHLGGGITQGDLLARGVAGGGDVDGDGKGDLLVGSIQASPDGRTEAGEVYLVYGFKP